MSKSFVYFIENTETNRIKIGHSKDVQSRLSSLNVASDAPLNLIGSIPGNSSLEKSFHEEFSDFRVRGEWFSGEIIERVREIIQEHSGKVRRLAKEAEAIEKGLVRIREFREIIRVINNDVVSGSATRAIDHFLVATAGCQTLLEISLEDARSGKLRP